MPKNTNRDYAVALFEATKDLKSADLQKVLNKFSEILFKAGVAKQINSIITEFIKYSKNQAGIVDIEITSARPLSGKSLEEIKRYFGNKVETTEKTDKSLIGGIKIKTENMIFDGSLQKQLQLLKQSIN